MYDITDDFEYLENCSYFYKNVNKLFKLESSSGEILSKSSRSNKPSITVLQENVENVEISSIEEVPIIHSIFKEAATNTKSEASTTKSEASTEPETEPLKLTKQNIELLYEDKIDASNSNDDEDDESNSLKAIVLRVHLIQMVMKAMTIQDRVQILNQARNQAQNQAQNQMKKKVCL